MRMRRLSAAIGAAALAVTLSACGSDNGDSGDGGGTGGGLGGGGEVAAGLTQANFTQTVQEAQADVKSAHIEASIDASGQQVTLSGDFAGFSDVDSLSMDMNMTLAGKKIEVRLVDKVLYIEGIGQLTNTSTGKPWVKVDLDDPSNPLSSLFDSANPESFTAYLSAVKSLDDKGTETVDGVSTRHYVITIDTAKALASNPAFKGQDVTKLGLPKTLTTDVWLNSDNLPVKMTVALGTAGSFEAHFSDYGAPVSVEAPPANQVQSLKLPN